MWHLIAALTVAFSVALFVYGDVDVTRAKLVREDIHGCEL
jgi:hypothetical protein